MEIIKLSNKKTLKQLLELHPNFKNLLGSDTKIEFLNNNKKTGHSGCPYQHGFKSFNCPHISCKECWTNLLKDYEW